MCELSDKQVCHDCVKEKYLSSYIFKNGKTGICDYCKENKIVFSLFKLKKIIESGFEFRYKKTNKEKIAENAIHNIAPSGFQCYIDVFDLLEKKYNISYNIELLEDLTKIIETEWWHDNSKNGLNLGEKKYYTWKIFSIIVKHETRYIFADINNPLRSLFDYIKPYKVLKDTLNIFHKYDLYEELIEDLFIYRVRKICTDCDANWTAKKLGSPPVEDCKQSNRFSPSGISMFYGSEDKDTCLKETGNPKTVVIGKWILPKGSKILDLTKYFDFSEKKYIYSDMPSIFDKTNRGYIHDYEFIIDFANDLSKPLEPDTNCYEYVPTQIVAEYLKMNEPDVIGICTYSSKNNGKNYTLFLDNDDCDKEEKINLVSYEYLRR